MNTAELSVQKRTISGRKVKNLRNEGLIPGVVYGKGFDSISVEVPRKAFEKVFAEAGETTVVTLLLDGQKYPVIIKDVTHHAVKDHPLNIDFYKVRLDEAISAPIPVHLIGESPAVKNFAGILVKGISEIEVEGLPQELPHAIEVDLSTLEQIGDQIMVKDLKISSKLKVKADPETIVVLVQEPAVEEAIPATTPSIEDVEVDSGKGKEEAEVIPEE
jgi:large subunit ribosomal protein L25